MPLKSTKKVKLIDNGKNPAEHQNQVLTRQFVLGLINEILKTQSEEGEEETDADIDIRISMRNEFIRCGLTDGRVRKIKERGVFYCEHYRLHILLS